MSASGHHQFTEFYQKFIKIKNTDDSTQISITFIGIIDILFHTVIEDDGLRSIYAFQSIITGCQKT